MGYGIWEVWDFDESLDAESATDCKNFLKPFSTGNPDKLAFARLNISSIRNKFGCYRIRLKAA